jgi:GNAT superfamily N-acetyltransferase
MNGSGIDAVADITIRRADYENPDDARALVEMLDAYARDPMGGNEPLPAYTLDNLAASLSRVPGAFSFLAQHGEQTVGLVNCFYGFSTFACQPLVNIHDIAVHADYRGMGVGQQLLAAVEATAREQGCCKLTLEVLSGNEPAKSAYRKYGFSGYSLDDKTGQAEFWQKKLPAGAD